MATPYRQVRLDLAPSTQDMAREMLEELPVLVMAAGQTEGRGRSGAQWVTARRALAVSLALTVEPQERRPFSLMAAVAATRAMDGITLKWPNDILVGEGKAGGILVERNGDTVVVGLGVNLWWPEAPAGATALHGSDPGPARHRQIGALWGAETMRLYEAEGWPLDEYRARCVTLGRVITWEPDGSGRAVAIGADGGLLVETAQGSTTIYSGAVRHVR